MTNSVGRSRPYRKGVGAVLFNSDGMVFVARRIDTPFEAWQLPQGGIKRREKPRNAVLRELKEEIGTDKAKILAKSSRWLSYDLPDDIAKRVWRGRYGGQKQRWFALKFTGTAPDIDLAASDHPEFDAWRWIPIDDLPSLAIWFKRSLYEEIVSEFRHLTQIVAGIAT
jgi:putative (di)nucleoside polyphosphate hydrolase